MVCLKKISVKRLLIFQLAVLPFYSFASGSDSIPLKVNGVWSNIAVKSSGKSITFEDSLGVSQVISLMLDANNIPAFFTSHIETPVCSDSLCNLMDIRIYWTLAGTYLGFDTIPGKPLTKNDHLDFNKQDFEKLHVLLCDEQSILRRRHKDDLFDKESSRVSQVVDAVTGATSKEVKEITVDGAVYSSYTIYHLVNSQIAQVIKNFVRDSLLSQLGARLSQSNRAEERVFFWQQIPAENFIPYQKEIIETIQMASPKDRLFVMKKMPSAMWAKSDFQDQLTAISSSMDIYSLSQVLNQFIQTPSVSVNALYNLSSQTKKLTQNQLNTYLQLIEKTKAALQNKPILEVLNNAAQDNQYKYRTIIDAFLQKYK